MKYSVKVAPVVSKNIKTGGILAFANVSFEDCLAVNGIRIVQGAKGPFVSMPNHQVENKDKPGEKEYKDYVFPITKEFREELYAAIFNAYEEELKKANKEVNKNSP